MCPLLFSNLTAQAGGRRRHAHAALRLPLAWGLGAQSQTHLGKSMSDGAVSLLLGRGRAPSLALEAIVGASTVGEEPRARHRGRGLEWGLG